MKRREFFRGLLGLLFAGSAKKVLGEEKQLSSELVKQKDLEFPIWCIRQDKDGNVYRWIYFRNYPINSGTLDFWDDPKEDIYTWTDGEPIR